MQLDLEQACARASAMINAGDPVREVLVQLASTAEQLAPGTVASILLLDDEGLLRNGASPNLPADYLDAIDRLKPDPAVGTCAAAAATGEIVLTPDFQEDSRWGELRHLPLALGLRGAWSMPIKSSAGAVLGTFGMYFRERRPPTLDEHAIVVALVAVASRALAATRPGLPA